MEKVEIKGTGLIVGQDGSVQESVSGIFDVADGTYQLCTHKLAAALRIQHVVVAETSVLKSLALIILRAARDSRHHRMHLDIQHAKDVDRDVSDLVVAEITLRRY